jgi:hypothetical protein
MAKLLGLRLHLAAAKTVDALAGGTALEPDGDGPIGHRVGQLADPGDRLRTERREVLEPDVRAPADTDGRSAPATVASVQHASQRLRVFLVTVEGCV